MIRTLALPKLFQYVPGPNFKGKMSQNHVTEFTPGHAGNIDRDSLERLSHRVRCHSLCNFLPGFDQHQRYERDNVKNKRIIDPVQ